MKSMLIKLVLWLQCHPQLVLSSFETYPVLRIPDGALMGEIGKTHPAGRDFYKFSCVPYGKHQRFQPSEPADPWSGIRDATQCKQSCPQVPTAGTSRTDLPTTEDCLILNVYTPAKLQEPEVSDSYPVMVFIHGGDFVRGSSLLYSGEQFMEEDVVIVTINYRLGALGFLSIPDGVIEGNLGLKDMVLALKWVQKNIKNFGGDPNKVTILGESSGGTAVGLLVLSPVTKGLFHQAISMSGSPLSPSAWESRPTETFENFANATNCAHPTTEESVECLLGLDYKVMNEPLAEMSWFQYMKYLVLPVIEWDPPKRSEAFLPDHPMRLLKEGNFQPVPYMIGVVEDESAGLVEALFGDKELMEDFNIGWIQNGPFVAGVYHRNITIPDIHKGLRRMRRTYFGPEEMTSKLAETILALFMDGSVVASMDLTIRHYSKKGPIYPYVFAKEGGSSGGELLKHLNRTVVSHGDDLQYLFKGAASANNDPLFGERYINLWVSFAYDGKPTATWGSAATWPQAVPETFDFQYYILDDDTALEANRFKERTEFWNSLFENEWSEI